MNLGALHYVNENMVPLWYGNVELTSYKTYSYKFNEVFRRAGFNNYYKVMKWELDDVNTAKRYLICLNGV